MRKRLAAAALVIPSVPVLAHHPLGGIPMETFSHGLLSGIGHPLLGFDHLFFVILVGIASAFTIHRLLAPLAYIAAMLGGCLIASIGTSIPGIELMVVLSLVVLGLMMVSGRKFGARELLSAFAGFGVFHGAAFGSSLAAQEAGFGLQVLCGYLLSLGLVQYAITCAGGWVCVAVWKASDANAMQPRLAGAMVTGVGIYLMLGHLEGPLLKVLVG